MEDLAKLACGCECEFALDVAWTRSQEFGEVQLATHPDPDPDPDPLSGTPEEEVEAEADDEDEDDENIRRDAGGGD